MHLKTGYDLFVNYGCAVVRNLNDRITQELMDMNPSTDVSNWNYTGTKEDMEKLFDVTATDETVINAFGGKQSRIAGRPTLLPAESILRVVKILTVGADKYGDENWRQITQKEHLDHALLHILLYLDGDKSEDHLGNAACRLLFSIADIVKDNKDENADVDSCGENTTA